MAAQRKFASWAGPVEFAPESREARAHLRLVWDAEAFSNNIIDPLIDEWHDLVNAAKFEDAIEECNRIIATHGPKLVPIAFALRGQAYRMAGQLKKAIADCNHSIHLQSNVAYHHFSVGACRLQSGQLKKAIAAFSAAISLQPESGVYWAQRGESYRRNFQFKEAIADCTHALDTLNYDAATAYETRADALVWISEIDRAYIDCKRAIELNPKSGFAHATLGKCLEGKGDSGKALVIYDRAIELGHNSTAAHFGRARSLLNLRRFKEAIDASNHVIQREPKWGLVYVIKASALKQVGDPQAALVNFSRAIELDPRHAFVYENRAHVHAILGHFQEGIADCDRAIALDPAVKYAHALRKDIEESEELGLASIINQESVADLIIDDYADSPLQTSNLNGTTDADLGGASVDDLLPEINNLASKFPEAARRRFIRTVKRAAALARGVQEPQNKTLRDREDSYSDALQDYEENPTHEHATALVSAHQSLRQEQKRLHLEPESRNPLVAQADSQRRPSTSSAPTQPGKPHRGRPRVLAVG